jgi:hypothetical protein
MDLSQGLLPRLMRKFLSRRCFLSSLGAAMTVEQICSARAEMSMLSSAMRDIAITSPITLDGHISYGQSWRTNWFVDFARWNLNPQPQTLIAAHVPYPLATFPPGPMSIGAGINLASPPNGFTGYPASGAPLDGSAFSIGRCSILAQQLYRVRSGSIPLKPIFEACFAYPGSTWDSGGGGGLKPGGTSWTNQTTAMADILGLLPSGIYSGLHVNSIGYTQGGAADGTIATKKQNLTDMMVAYDAYGWPGGPIQIYLGIAAPISNATSFDNGGTNPSGYGTYLWARDNLPSGSGAYANRAFATTPWYQWPFDGVSNIHSNDYGTIRHGEVEGYVRYLVRDKRYSWTPLWRDPATPLSMSGQTIVIPFTRPPGPDFVSSPMEFSYDSTDGIRQWPQQGFHVFRGGTELTLQSITISGLTVLIMVSETVSTGDNLEVSYAWYGPGGPNPGTCSGVGGNLNMAGPDSAFFVGKKLRSWGWPFKEAITV